MESETVKTCANAAMVHLIDKTYEKLGTFLDKVQEQYGETWIGWRTILRLAVNVGRIHGVLIVLRYCTGIVRFSGSSIIHDALEADFFFKCCREAMVYVLVHAGFHKRDKDMLILSGAAKRSELMVSILLRSGLYDNKRFFYYDEKLRVDEYRRFHNAIRKHRSFTSLLLTKHDEYQVVN